MLGELTRVRRYPRMLALYGISEKRVYDFVSFLLDLAGRRVPGKSWYTIFDDILLMRRLHP